MDRYDRAPAEFDERLLEALVPMHEAIPELADVAGEKLRDEFEGEWPFRAEKVIVECRGKWCAIVNVGGYAFALNCLATGHFKLPDPHQAGVAILGRPLFPFTDIAHSLGELVDSDIT